MTKNISIFFHIYSLLFVTFKYLIVWTYPFCDSLMYFIVFLLYILYNTFMKFLVNLKNKFGMNLIAIIGWCIIYLYLWIQWTEYKHHGTIGMFVLFLIEIVELLICIGLIIWIVEIVADHKIKNKFILENKIYNIFWIIGMCASLFLTSFTINLFVEALY